MPYHTSYYQHALQHLAQHPTPLPELCTILDLVQICDLPYAWIIEQLQHDALPGTCFGAVHQWRCQRQTLIEWLKEHANEYAPSMAGAQRRHSPHHPPSQPHRRR